MGGSRFSREPDSDRGFEAGAGDRSPLGGSVSQAGGCEDGADSNSSRFGMNAFDEYIQRAQAEWRHYKQQRELEKEMELARIEESAAAVDALFSGEDCSPPAAALAALHDQDPSWRSDTASPHRHAQIEDASRRQESITSTPVIHPEPAARQLFPGWTLTPAQHHTAETGPPQSLQHAQLLAHRQPARTTPVLMQSAPPARIRSAPVNPNLKSPAWPGAGARQMQFDPESGRAPEYGDMFML